MTNQVYIGEWRVDLYGDENVEVVSSVLDISDITLNTTDYSKSFAVPASKENNKLFKHWYNANIDNTFDARTKVPGRIDLGGKPFKIGKFRLQKVSVKKGKPDSYIINFFGNLTSLVDTVKKDYLSDLDLSAYDHDYDSATVETGLTDSLFSSAIIYVLFPKKQYYYNNNVSDNVQTETLANIAWGGGANTGVIWNDLRPGIKIIKIIEAIETDYGITFSRDFFGLTEFTKLNLWLNPDSQKETAGETLTIDWDGGDSSWMNLTTDIGSYDAIADPFTIWFLELEVIPSVGYETIPYVMKIIVNEEVQGELAINSGTGNLYYDVDEIPSTNNISFQVQSGQEFKYTANLIQKKRGVGTIEVETTTATEQTIESKFIISEEIPKIKIIDFLKGLFNMFKLVVIPQDDGTIYIDNLDYFYAKGGLYDITKYVDFDSFDVERGKILNEISFKFEDPTTILNMQFKQNNNIAYGDEEVFLEDDAGEPLDGDSLTFKLPFEQIVYERLPDINDNVLTNIMYGAIIGDDLAPVNPKGHIFYAQKTPIGSKTLAFIDDTGTKTALSANINTPCHGDTLENDNYSTIFGSEFDEWDGVAITNTLYKNHHERYILDIFNIKKRSFKYTAQMPNFIMTKLRLNDILKIKGNYYRINKYNYNLLTDKTTFDLINSFDNTINGFRASSTIISVPFPAVTEIINVTNAQSATILKVDLGSGTAWASVSFGATAADYDKLTIAFLENTSEVNREMQITLTQAVTGATQEIYIYQSPEQYYPSFDFSDSRNSQYISTLLTGKN